MRAGCDADFIVLDANPLDAITNTRRIARVVFNGDEIDRAALRRDSIGHVRHMATYHGDFQMPDAAKQYWYLP